jgi:signal transduction histidine kinase
MLLTVLLATSFEKKALRATRADSAQSLSERGNVLHTRLEAAIVTKMTRIEALAAVIAVSPYQSEQRFSSIVSGMFGADTGFTNIAAASDLVVRYVYPLAGNEAVLGLDYRKNVQQRAAVERTRGIKGSLLTGPVDLVQGGRGLIVRAPIFRQDKFLGIVSGVIDFETFLQETGLKEINPLMSVAIQTLADGGAPAKPFFGKKDILRQNPLLFNIDFPNGSWQMAVVPKSGWPVHSTKFVQNNLLFAFLGMVFLGFIFSIINLLQRRIRAENTLSCAVEAIEDGFALYDENDRLEVFNSKYVSIYGASKDVLKKGNRFEDIVRYGVEHGQFPEAIDRPEAFIQERVALHRLANSTIEQKIDGGRWLKISERKTPDGGVVGIRTDITDLKDAKDVAERANEAKSTFLNIMGHELRTPLTVILGYTPLLGGLEKLPSYAAFRDALEQKSVDMSDLRVKADRILQDVLKFTSKIEESGKHLLTLINDILALSNIESGPSDLEVSEIDISAFFAGLDQGVIQAARNKGLEVRVGAMDGTIVANLSDLTKICENLICNAAKFTDEGTITITSKIKGSSIEFQISDTGCGIPEAHFQRIFNPFTQVDDSDAREVNGAGLGLAIVKKLVSKLGGNVGVVSVVGRGSTFWFTVPLAAQRAEKTCQGAA